MRIKLLAVAATGLLALGLTTACDDSKKASNTTTDSGTGVTGGGKPHIGVILPDNGKTSTRWKTDDPKYLKQAFQAAGVTADIQNADGSVDNFKHIADQMINSGVTVLMIVNLDSDSGKAVLQEAKAKSIKTIDYDRLTLGGAADYYVSFDNEAVGVLQARALISCMGLNTAQVPPKGTRPPIIAELNGSPTDNNATLFKQGYDSVLQPLYEQGVLLKGPDQSTPDWDADKGSKLFAQMLQQQPAISGVIAANDGLADAVIQVLKRNRPNAKLVPITGQDATVRGLQYILAGEQCMTVYKSVQNEANQAAQLAVALYNRQEPKNLNVTKLKDPETGAYMNSVLLPPLSVTNAAQISQSVLHDGYVTRSQLCTGVFAGICQNAGIK